VRATRISSWPQPARMIAAGASSDSDHGRDILETLYMSARARPTPTRSPTAKLKRLAAEYGIATEDKNDRQIAKSWLGDHGSYGMRRDRLPMAGAPPRRAGYMDKTGVIPRGIDRENVRDAPRTHMEWTRWSTPAARRRTSLSDGWAAP